MAMTIETNAAYANGGRIDGPSPAALQALARAIAPDAAAAEGELLDLAEELRRSQAAETAPGLDDQERDRRASLSGEIVDAMIERPARTLRALKAKAATILWCWGGEDAWRAAAQAEQLMTAERATFAIVSDLLAATGEAGELRSRAEMRPGESELIRAARDFMIARHTFNEANSRYLAARDAAAELHPERPGAGQTAAVERWTAQCAAIDSSFGVPALADAVDRALAAEDVASDRVVAARPATIREAVAKYAVLLAAYVNPNGEEIAAPDPFIHFLADLEHLAGC